MKRCILVVAIMMGSAAMSLHAESKEAEIKLRKLKFSGLSIDKGNLSLVATFDVKYARILDEVKFDYFLLLYPRDKKMKTQFLHCRTLHRYLDKKSSLTSGVSLDYNALESINPQDSKYAVVITYKGNEVGVENSEDDRWWEDSSLGDPVENVLKRVSAVPIVREWESVE